MARSRQFEPHWQTVSAAVQGASQNGSSFELGFDLIVLSNSMLNTTLPFNTNATTSANNMLYSGTYVHPVPVTSGSGYSFNMQMY
jgi:hypothetical protein